MAPLVSFCVKCFNQRRFIGAALEGAFAQTYRPLELVVSDDGSDDGSWEVIEAAVRDYRRGGGDLTVIVNRNEKNLGNLGNWLKICELAHGELLVKADGDDVSLPERTSRIVEAWSRDGFKSMCVSHSAFLISPSGLPLGSLPRRVSAAAPVGAAMAFSRKTFTEFGPPSDLTLVDDELFARRALFLGGETVFADRLVKYRTGTGVSSSQWDMRSVVRRNYGGLAKSLEMSLADLDHVEQRLGPAECGRWRKRLSRELADARDKVELASSPSFSRRLAAARRLVGIRAFSVWGWFRLAFVLPRFLGTPMLLAYALARNVARVAKGVVSR